MILFMLHEKEPQIYLYSTVMRGSASRNIKNKVEHIPVSGTM